MHADVSIWAYVLSWLGIHSPDYFTIKLVLVQRLTHKPQTDAA